MKYSLGISNFIKRSLVFPILLFSSISLRCSQEGFLCLLAILWNAAFRCLYFSFSPLPFTSFLFSDILLGKRQAINSLMHSILSSRKCWNKSLQTGVCYLYKGIREMAPLRGYLSRVLREVRDHVVIFSERVHDGRKNKGKARSQESFDVCQI